MIEGGKGLVLHPYTSLLVKVLCQVLLEGRCRYNSQKFSEHKYQIRLDYHFGGFGQVHGQQEQKQGMALDEGFRRYKGHS